MIIHRSLVAWCLLAAVASAQTKKGTKGVTPPRFEDRRAPAARIDEDSSSSPAGADDRYGDRYGRPRDAEPSGASKGRSQFEADPEIAPRTGGGRARDMTSIDPPATKIRAPEILAESLQTLKEGALEGGQPLPLTIALSRVQDRQQQIKVAAAYWKLATAQADYHFARTLRIRFQQVTKDQLKSSPGVYSSRASFRGVVRDAELSVVKAQHEISQLINIAPTDAPPLASDRPHVGDYNTLYDTIFKGRAAPPSLQLIHRLLPVRRKAIEDHALAIVKAKDSLQAVEEDYRGKEAGLVTLLASLEQLHSEEHNFLMMIRAHNQEIAEYAISTAPQGTPVDKLVGMMIKVKSPQSPAQSGGTRPNNLDRGESEPRRDTFAPIGEEDTSGARLRSRTTTNMLQSDGASVIDAGLYGGLVGADPKLRAQKLAMVLHDVRSLPAGAGEPTSLKSVLARLAPANRKVVIESYWKTREKVARYQALTEELEALNALGAAALHMRNEPQGPTNMLRVQAAKQAVKANMHDEFAALVRAEFELTQLAGRPIDKDLILPTTAPHAGRYLMRLDTQPRNLVESAAVQLSKRLIPTQHDRIVALSAAIVYADVARATATAGTSQSQANFNTALAGISHEANQTMEFLAAMTRYNVALVDYVTIVAPNLDNDKFVEALVVASSDKS